jgi:beta-glucosidase
LQSLAVEHTRMHIPLLFGYDVIHGHKTIFPIPLALSCTWNPELIEKSARMAAREASADGVNWTFSPMVDIARDPRWGRIAESAGEDPYLGSLIAQAMVRGYQGGDLTRDDAVMACVKHFALYGAAQAGRDYNPADMSRLSMYQYYLPPYKAAVEAGVGSVMMSFNEVDGIPATAMGIPRVCRQRLHCDQRNDGTRHGDAGTLRATGFAGGRGSGHGERSVLEIFAKISGGKSHFQRKD